MEFDTVDNNFILKHKIVRILYGLWLVAVVAILEKLAFDFQFLVENEEMLSRITAIILFSPFLLILLNAVVFIRNGKFKIGEEKIILTVDSIETVVQVNEIKSVKIYSIERKMYNIKLMNQEVTLLIKDKTKLTDLKAFFISKNIEIENKNLWNRILKFFGKKVSV